MDIAWLFEEFSTPVKSDFLTDLSDSVGSQRQTYPKSDSVTYHCLTQSHIPSE